MRGDQTTLCISECSHLEYKWTVRNTWYRHSRQCDGEFEI